MLGLDRDPTAAKTSEPPASVVRLAKGFRLPTSPFIVTVPPLLRVRFWAVASLSTSPSNTIWPPTDPVLKMVSCNNRTLTGLATVPNVRTPELVEMAVPAKFRSTLGLAPVTVPPSNDKSPPMLKPALLTAKTPLMTPLIEPVFAVTPPPNVKLYPVRSNTVPVPLSVTAPLKVVVPS